MPAWLQRDWCSPFVLSLGHFLWQGTLIAVVLAIALRATKSVAARYWMSLAALLVMAACPVVTLGWLMWPVDSGSGLQNSKLAGQVVEETKTLGPPILNFEDLTPASRDVGQVSNLPVIPSAPAVELNTEPSGRSPNLQAATDDRSWWQKFAPQLTTTYLCGVGLMLLRLVFGLWGGRRLRRRVHLIDDPSLLGAMQRQAAALGLKLLPILAYCERVTVPTVVGVLKPMILLPLALNSGLSPEQIESVLAHELAHLRRYDHLVNLLQRVIESLLFFHPAMWWVSHRIREEREHCCDDLVVACGAMPLDYAKSLLRVAELSRASKLRRSIAAVSLLATGNTKPSNLRQRIARLLGESATPSLRVSPRALLLAICIPLVALIVTIQAGAGRGSPDPTLNPTASLPNSDDESNQSNNANGDVRLAPPEKYSANLPNGVEVELAGVAMANVAYPDLSKRRKDDAWWRADGTRLKRPPMKLFSASVDESQKDSREFAIKLTPPGDEQLISASYVTWTPSPPRGSSGVGGWDIDGGKPGVLKLQHTAGFKDETPVAVHVFVSDQPLGPAWLIDVNGRALPQEPTDAKTEQLRKLIDIVGVEKSDNETIFRSKRLPAADSERLEFNLRAIDQKDQPHSSSESRGSEAGDGRVFKLAAADIKHFEIRLRPMTQKVTFENVSLVPGEMTDVKIKVEAVDPLAPNQIVLASVPAVVGSIPELGLGQRQEKVIWSHDSQQVYATGTFNKLTLWLREESRWQPKSLNAKHHANSIAASGKSPLIVIGTNNGTAEVWDAKTLMRVHELRSSPQYSVYAVAISADERLVAACGTDGTVAVFELATGKFIARLGEKAPTRMSSLAFSPDGQTLAAMDRYGQLVLWNLAERTRIAEWNGIAGGEDCSMQWASDGRRLAVSGPGRVTLVSTEKGRQPQVVMAPEEVLSRHPKNDALSNSGPEPGGIKFASVTAISLDVRTVASIAPDGSVGIWDLATRTITQKLPAPPESVIAKQWAGPGMRNLVLSPDGRRLAATNLRGDVIFWQLAEGKAQAAATQTPTALTPQANETALPKGLEFLKPYPKLHGLSLDMTEPQFLEIVKQQELQTRKTVMGAKSEGEKVTYHIALGDGHSLIVMFGNDEKCSGIQRVRSEATSDAEQQSGLAAERPEAEQLRKLVRGGKIDGKTINALITLVAARGAEDMEFARLVLAEFGKSCEGGDRTSQSRRYLLAVVTDIFEAWSSPRWRSQLRRFKPEDLPQTIPPQVDAKFEREMLARVIQHGYATDRSGIANFSLAVRQLHHPAGREFLREVLRSPTSESDPFDADDPPKTVPQLRPQTTPSPKGNSEVPPASRWKDNTGGGWTDAKFVAAVGLAELGEAEGIDWLLARARPNEFGIDRSLFSLPHIRDASGSLRESSRLALADLFGLSAQVTVTELGDWWGNNRAKFTARPAMLKPILGREARVLAPTAALPNSDDDTKPTNNANGDLRSNPAAGSGDPRRAQAGDWGPTTNGLRARVVPVLSSMSAEAIDPAQRVTKFAKGDDVAFVVELENVSDQPIKLLDLWHDAKSGKPIQDADWLSQLVCSVVLFDGDGKRIEQPEIEVEDPVFILHDAQVTTLQPGKTQQFLIKTVEWLPVFKPQIQAGSYRVAVRYQWLSGPNAARTREAHPKSSLLEAAAVNVVSAAVAIEVGGESRKADPDLVWGQAIKGLRAAVSFGPSRGTHTHDKAMAEYPPNYKPSIATYTHGDKLAVNLHLQNVGTQPLKLVTDLSLPDASATIKNEMGKRVALDDRGGGLSGRLRGLLTLKPQQVVVLDAGNLGLASSKEQAKQLDEETIRQLTAPVGKYSVQLANTFNNTLIQRVFVPGQEPVRVKDAWVGKLTTGATPLVIAVAPVVGVREEVKDKPAEIGAFVQVFPPPVVGDFSKVNDPDELLDQLAKSQLPSLEPRTGGGFFHQTGMPPQAMYVTIWETQYAGSDKLDPRIRRLIELGDRAVPRVHQRLNGLAASDHLAAHLTLVLRSAGTTESVPALIKLLKTKPTTVRDGTQSIGDEIKGFHASVTEIAVTSALWKLTGRKHVFTPDQWEKWWQSVKPDFVVLRERQRPEFVSRVTPERINALANDLATNEVAARERLISLGPAALPHLLKVLSVAESLRDSESASRSDAATRRLAWVIDELGATDKLPAKLRRDYFAQRFSDDGTFAGMYPIDEDALCRALSHCSFTDYCSIFLEADSQGNVAPHMQHIKWPMEIYAAYCRRFSKIVPPNLGGWSNNTRWEKVVPAEDPAGEIASAVPMLVAALKDERVEWRASAGKLAAAIGFCSTAKPEALIVALRDAWLAEADEKVRPAIAFAMCRFGTPFVVKEISSGLNSERPEIVCDCAGLMDSIPIKLNDETRAAFDRLVELTRHENDRFRRSATRSLAYKAPQLLGPEFERLCTDKNKDIREACTLALRSDPDPKHADILFKLADDADQSIRESAFSSIGNLKHPPSMKRLLPYLRDKKVQGSALSALVSMGGEDALPLMMSELEAGNDVSGNVYQYLRRFTGEKFEEKPEPWLAWWKQQKPAPKPVPAQKKENEAEPPKTRSQAEPGNEKKMLGTLSGRFVFDGQPPVLKDPYERFANIDVNSKPLGPDVILDGVERMYRDFLTHGIRPKTADQTVLVGKDGGIANVVVWLVSRDVPWTRPAEELPPVSIRFKDGNASPRIAVVTVGQRLLIENHDPLTQAFATEFSRALNPPASLTLPPSSADSPSSASLKFRAAEPFPAHYWFGRAPWASGRVMIHSNPFVAVSQPDGSFTLPNLPQGEWEFQVFHERGGNLSYWPKGRFKQTIKPGDNSLGTIKVKPEQLGQAPLQNNVATPQNREQIGEVLGKPIYRDQIKEGGLPGLFFDPVRQDYLKAHQAELTPTEAEMLFAAEYYEQMIRERLKANGGEAALRERLEAIESQLAKGGLSEAEEQKLESEHFQLRRDVDVKKTASMMAAWSLTNWKGEKHLYDKFGGGRVLVGSMGHSAFDAGRRQMESLEAEGKFKVTDPALRAQLFEQWTRDRGTFLKSDPEEIRRLLLEPEYVAPGGANKVQSDKIQKPSISPKAKSESQGAIQKPSTQAPLTPPTDDPLTTPAADPFGTPTTVAESGYPVIKQISGEQSDGWIACEFGLQYRVRAETTSLVAGELPLLFVDVRNRGTFKDMGLELHQSRHSVVAGGNRYERRDQPWAGVAPLEPEGKPLTLAFALSEDWKREGETKTALKLTQGKHRIALSLMIAPVYPSSDEPQTTPASRKPIFRSLVCRPIEIEIRSGAWPGPPGSLGLENIRREVIAIPDFHSPKVPANLQRLVHEHQPAAGEFLVKLIKSDDPGIQQAASVVFANAWDSMNREQIESYLLATMTHFVWQRPQYPQGVDAMIGMGPRHRPEYLGLPPDRKYSAETITTLKLDGVQVDQPIKYPGLGSLSHWVKTKDLSLGRHTLQLATKFTFTRGTETYRGEFDSPEFVFEMVPANTPDDLIAPHDEQLDRLVREALLFAETEYALNHQPGSENFDRLQPEPPESEKWSPQIRWGDNKLGLSSLHCPVWKLAKRLPVDLCFAVEFHVENSDTRIRCNDFVSLAIDGERGSYFSPHGFNTSAEMIKHADKDGFVTGRLVLKPSRAAALTDPKVKRYFGGEITSKPVRFKVVVSNNAPANQNR